MNEHVELEYPENGYYNEFRTAQQNLQANIAAGQGNTFAYTGAPGTAPLPIFMAHFAGVPLADPRNQNPASYTSSNFRSSSWYNQLSMLQPEPDRHGRHRARAACRTRPTYANATAAGLPANFFMANPAVSTGQCVPARRTAATRGTTRCSSSCAAA